MYASSLSSLSSESEDVSEGAGTGSFLRFGLEEDFLLEVPEVGILLVSLLVAGVEGGVKEMARSVLAFSMVGEEGEGELDRWSMSALLLLRPTM